MGKDKFIAQIDEFELVSPAPAKTSLPDDVIQEANDRIAAGEDSDKVITELAHRELAMFEFEQETEIRSAAASDRSAQPSLRRDNNAVHKAGDAHAMMFRVAAKAALNAGKRTFNASHNADVAAKVVGQSLKKTMPKLMASTFVAGGKATKVPARQAAPADTTFNFHASNEDAATWAEQHAGEMIDGIEQETKDRLGAAVASNQRGDTSLKDLLASVESIFGEDRADIISRTESMTAANEGNRQSIANAIDMGLLPDDARRVWIATSDCCDDCGDLDGETTDEDGNYPDDGEDGPPLHPNCRCTEGVAGEED